MSQSARNETQLVKAIERAIIKEYPNAWVLKVHGGGYQRVGVPDLLISVDGKLIGLEVKHQKASESEERARGRATAVQKKEIQDLRRSGARAEIVLSSEEALSIINDTVIQ